MRHALIGLWMFICSATAAFAQVSIGINISLFPELVRVPGYPVYYAPQLSSNFFFYDGMYWVYQDDEWYSSSWYNGPWFRMAPQAVPLFVLRVPVRYYRSPPHYFRNWRASAPPRWGDHWGRDWEHSHRGWDRWDRRSAPPPAPLPRYQRQYSGERYPDMNRQQDLHQQNYRYQPRDAATRSQTRERNERQHELQRAPVSPSSPADRPSRREQEQTQRSAPAVVAPAPVPQRAPEFQDRQERNSRVAPPEREPRVNRQEETSRTQPAVEQTRRVAPVPAPAPQRAPELQDRRERNPRAAPPEHEPRASRQENTSRAQAQAEQPRRGGEREKDRGRERDGEREQGRGR